MSRKAKDFQELNKLMTKPKKSYKAKEESSAPVIKQDKNAPLPPEAPKGLRPLTRPAKPNQRKKLVTPKVAIKDYPI